MKYSFDKTAGVLALISLIMFSGCYSSKPIREFSELRRAVTKEDPINILTVDTTVYNLVEFTFTDSTISGIGSSTRKDSRKDFEGTLNFNEIVFIERLSPNGWKAFWLIPMTAAIAGGMLTLMQPAEFEIWRPASGSCPFIYSYNGSEFILEAEAFSTGISKALETETFHMLSSLVPEDGELKVRISNERPETHLFNKVELYAVDAASFSVVLDIDNKAWPVVNARPPVEARDHEGFNILNEVSQKEGLYWKSDLESTQPASGFRDTLELSFLLPERVNEATFIVDAINSELINEVYAAIGAVVGDHSLLFYRALEEDPELKSYFVDWIQKSSLRVELKEANGWREVGSILPEANEVPFTRAIRIKDLGQPGDSLKLRLISMTDVWHLDAVSLDYSDVDTLAMHPLNKIRVEASVDDLEVKEALSKSDSLYAMLLPPDSISLTFDASPAAQMQHPLYVMSAQGYLYEWFPSTKNIPYWKVPNWLKEVDRKEVLKVFSEMEDRFLQSIYAEWREEMH